LIIRAINDDNDGKEGSIYVLFQPQAEALTKERSGRAVRVAVNISGADLMRSDFVEDMKVLVEGCGIEKSDLEFEITESLFMDDLTVAQFW